MKNTLRLKATISLGWTEAVWHVLAGLFCLLLSSCVTSPLKTQSQRDRVAEAMGYSPDEITFMQLCFFEEIQEQGSEKRLKGVRGVIAKTDSEICLMDGAMGLAPTRHFLKIPISEIEGVSGFPGQIQIGYQDRLLVLVVYNWDDFRPNSTLTNDMYKSLIAAKVPHFEAQDHYSWSMLSPRRSSTLSGPTDYFPHNDKVEQIRAFSQEQTARDREFENNRR